MAHRLAPEAKVDLLDLWSYVADERSIETADRLVDSISARSSCCQGILTLAGSVTTFGLAFAPLP